MNILSATKFHGFIEKGGSTIPWKVTLRNFKGEENAYIVKVFKKTVNNQQFATAKEFYGNILAKEFDLLVPECAFADFTQSFIKISLGKNERRFLQSKDQNLKFASRYIEGAPVFSNLLHRNVLKEYDFAQVYAFDFLCANLDRGGFRNKPNLLIDDDDIILIDHEQTFPFIDSQSGFEKFMEDFKNETTYYQYQKHIFYPYLLALRTKAKRNLFDGFFEYLKNFNVNPLISSAKQMESLGINTGNWKNLVNYLSEIKDNRQKFCKLLLKSIA